MTGDPLFSDFGILSGLLVNGALAFTGANRPNCLEADMETSPIDPPGPIHRRRQRAELSLSPHGGARLVDSIPDASVGNTLNQKLESAAGSRFNRYRTRAASYGRDFGWCLVPV